MELNRNELFFASLVGSKIAEKIPQFQIIQNELQKKGLPTIPFLPLRNKPVKVADPEREYSGHTIWEADAPLSKDDQFFPLSVKRRGTNDPFYTLPYEPMVNISGSNEIITRKVAKAPGLIGTIKEHWSQDDYSISITGTLIGKKLVGSAGETFPRADFEKLRDYMTHPKGLEVQCEPLQLLGINYLVVESFDFPFTKGENVQAYTIQCLSDFSVDFLLEIED
jgi:hypothetical protein